MYYIPKTIIRLLSALRNLHKLTLIVCLPVRIPIVLGVGPIILSAMEFAYRLIRFVRPFRRMVATVPLAIMAIILIVASASHVLRAMLSRIILVFLI